MQSVCQLYLLLNCAAILDVDLSPTNLHSSLTVDEKPFSFLNLIISANISFCLSDKLFSCIIPTSNANCEYGNVSYVFSLANNISFFVAGIISPFLNIPCIYPMAFNILSTFPRSLSPTRIAQLTKCFFSSNEILRNHKRKWAFKAYQMGTMHIIKAGFAIENSLQYG